MTPNSNATLSTNEITGDSFEAETGAVGHGSNTAAVQRRARYRGQHVGPRPTAASYTLDLGATYTLGEVRAWQRLDGCCQDRLSNFRLELLADNGSGGVGGVVSTVNYPGQAPTNSYASFNLGPTGRSSSSKERAP